MNLNYHVGIYQEEIVQQMKTELNIHGLLHSQAHPEIEFGIPLDAEKMPLRGVDWNDFKGIRDFCFGEPCALSSEFY